MKIELTSTNEAPDPAALTAAMVYARLLHPEPVAATPNNTKSGTLRPGKPEDVPDRELEGVT